jgi:transcriptional regulator with XRE-family HTH domain
VGYVIRRLDPLTEAALRALGEVLLELRRERAISQRQLAWYAGVHQSTISRLETGKAAGFRVEALARLLAGLERPEPYRESVWLPEAPAGWELLSRAFSTKGAFARRAADERRERAERRSDLMQPRASRERYGIRPRVGRRA